MLKTRTHINELETKIALDLVHRYLGIQQLVFSKWRHSLETGSWSSIITINGVNIINYIVDDISAVIVFQVLFVILKVFISDLEKKRNLFSLLMS